MSHDLGNSWFPYLGYEPEDVDLLRLTDSMSTIHGLKIGLRIPIAVVQNDNIGCGQVDTQTSGARREQEDELVTARTVVLVDGDNSFVMCRATVNTTICCGGPKVRSWTPAKTETRTISSEKTIILENVENTTHLTENENARAFCFHSFKQLVENDHFARVLN